MLERRLYLHTDWLLVATVYVLCAIGVVLIYSTTDARTGDASSRLVLTQIYAIGIGTLALTVCLRREVPVGEILPFPDPALPSAKAPVPYRKIVQFPPQCPKRVLRLDLFYGRAARVRE